MARKPKEKKSSAVGLDPTLKKLILKLSPTGKDGFEELALQLLEDFTGRAFALFASGWQAGQDFRTAGGPGPLITVQCKRYDKAPRATMLLGDLTAAILNNNQLEVMVFATTASLPAQTLPLLEQAGAKFGVSVLPLDGPTLEALLCRFPEKTKTFIPDASNLEELAEKRSESHISLLKKFTDGLHELPLPGRLLAGCQKYLLKRQDGISRDLGRRIALTQYVTREAEAKLVSWWQENTSKPLVVLAEEGMGKTTMVASWVAQSEFTLPVLWVSSQDIALKSEVEDIVVLALLKLGKDCGFSTTETAWRARVQRWKTVKSPRFLLVIDGLNELPKETAERLLLSLLPGADWSASMRALLTCRPDRWKDLLPPKDRKCFEPMPVKAYSDTELAKALTGTGLDIRTLPSDTVDLIRVPLYLAAAKDNLQDLKELPSATRETLCWYGLKHRMQKGSGLAKGLALESDAEALQFLKSLAKRQLENLEGKLPDEDFHKAAEVFMSRDTSPISVLRQLRSSGLVRQECGKSEVDPDHLILGGGLFLFYQCLEKTHKNQQQNLIQDIQAFLEPHSVGLEARFLEAAILMSKTEEPSPQLQATRVSLLLAWTQAHNFNESSERALSREVPSLLVECLELAEQVWKDWTRLTRIRSRLVASFVTLASTNQALPSLFFERLERWLRLYHPASEERAIGNSYKHAATSAGGWDKLAAQLGLIRAETLSQTNLFYVAMVVLSVRPERNLFSAVVDSVMAGATSGRHTPDLYAWIVGLLLGPTFPNDLLDQKEIPDSIGLRTKELDYLLYLGLRRSLAPRITFNQNLHKALRIPTQEDRTDQIVEELLSSDISNLWSTFESSKDLFLDPDFIKRLNIDLADSIEALRDKLIERMDPKNSDSCFWRHHAQTETTLLYEASKSFLCTLVPDAWSDLMSRQLCSLASALPPGFLTYGIPLLGPVLDKNALWSLLRALSGLWKEHAGVYLSARIQDLLAPLLLLTTPEEQLKLLDEVPDEMLPLFPLAPVVESLATPSLAEGLVALIEKRGHKLFYTRLLAILAHLVPEEAERIAIEEWHSGVAERRESAGLLLSSLNSPSAAQAILKSGWKWREELVITGLLPIARLLSRQRDQLDTSSPTQLVTLLPLDYCGAVLDESSLEEYIDIVEQVLTIQSARNTASKKSLPIEVQPSSDFQRDCGSVSPPLKESKTIDLRALGHWKGPDSTDELEMSITLGSTQEQLDNELEEWLQELQERQDSEPFFSRWEASEALKRLAQNHLFTLQKWADELLCANPSTSDELYHSRSAFYWGLTLRLLRDDPKRGAALWRRLIDIPGFRLIAAQVPIPEPLRAIFEPGVADPVIELRRFALEHVDNDLRLHNIALAADMGERSWLEQWASKQLSHERDLNRAIAARVLGWLSFNPKTLEQLEKLRDSEDSIYVAKVAEAACEDQRRDRNAQYWFQVVTSESNYTKASAAAQLFLMCADTRAYLWKSSLASSGERSPVNRYLETILFHTLRGQSRNHQRQLKENFLGTKRQPLQGLAYPHIG